ncbi:hypothetical protein [Streptomyces sp. P17]|uniref:hypothetical protein n=1 Tax=Streptomyces sp. P17 TaxID=3074716 RepID=UPI0028F44131|nr:hypothetical protein [Streptomyces sp. P17]MDT9701358.1 hypothetical protein [Streptomyces sp. P17]
MPQSGKAGWIVTQANRSLICGSDVPVKLSDAEWSMEAGGWQVQLGTWCGHDTPLTGNLHVPALTAAQTAPKPTRYSHWAS